MKWISEMLYWSSLYESTLKLKRSRVTLEELLNFKEFEVAGLVQ